MSFAHQFQGFLGDLHFAGRSLRRSPGFTATTLISLALGVTLTASTLAVMNSYLVRAMPYPASDRLYRVLYDSGREPEPHGLESLDWKLLNAVVEVADYSTLDRFILNTEQYPQEIAALMCAPGSLAALGVQATLGRVFSDEEFRPGGERVVMISHALWQERFGSDPHVTEKTLRASAATSGETPTEYRIIGVLPAGFRYVGNYLRGPADIALPLTAPRTTYMARLREGVPVAFAERRITEAVRKGASAIPANWKGVRLESVQANYVRELRPVLVGVTIAAALVLLIVVTNIVVLTLLRALRRQKETAVRVALGADLGHIARLLLAETAVICGLALAGGLALTVITLRALAPAIEARLGRPVPGGVSALAMDWTVVSWVGGIGLLITALVSCLPLIGTRLKGLADSLRGEGRSGTDRPAMRRARTVLIALEIAASTALLIGGGLMIRTVVHLTRTDLGFATEHVFRPRVQLPERTYREVASFVRFYDRWEEQLAAVPNLSFAFSTFVPFWEPPKRPLGTDSADSSELRASITSTGTDYFRTLGIGLREGRAFTSADRAGAELVAVISESLARELAPHGSALGTRIRTMEWANTGPPPRVWRTVVGVAHDVHQTHADVDLKDVYIPFAQAPSRFASVYIRAEGSSEKWLETLRTLAAKIDPEVFIGPALPLSVQAESELAGPRFVTTALTLFALFAALLTLLGIYGVTAYSVQQREREIAIRMAIGATSGAVIRMFLRSSGQVLLVGIAGGLFGAAAVSRVLQSQLHGVARFDAWTLAGAGSFLMAAGLIATWLPTRRAAHTNPVTALRAE